MQWLLTVPADVDLDELARRLIPLDAELSSEPPVPMGNDEQVLGATGPRDLPDRVREAGLPVSKVSPDSGMTLY